MSKLYMPNELINSNYTYYINNNYITIRTNKNCYNNYNSTYCDCYDIFPNLDYAITNAYSCYSSSTHSISYDNFTSDYWYRLNIDKSLIIFSIIFIFGFLFPYKIISRCFGRWLKI